LPLLIKTSGGAKAVINIVSGGLHTNTSSLVPVSYAVSKSAVARLTEHLDNFHGKEDRIVAFALHPGGVRTELTVGCPGVWDYSKYDNFVGHLLWGQ
jgi:NAD(P)-dependent dehydrogenase (short-subunit alcohol dehydrogenase family)